VPVAIDIHTPEGLAFSQLGKLLYKRRDRLDRLYAYYEGCPPLPETLSNLRDIAHDFFRTSRTNLAELVADAPRERMKPSGVRTSVDDDDSGDEVAWGAWMSAGLSLVASDVHQHMCVLGDGYAIVSWSDARDAPVVTAEDPRQVYTRHDPLTGDVVDAIKIYRDEDAALDYGYLYRPGMVLVATKPAGILGQGISFNANDWTWDLNLSRPLPTALAKVVPVVRFRNRDGVGEFERHTDTLDRINRVILRGLVTMTFQAFKQRAVQGDLPETDKDGNLINYDELLKSGPDALWLLPPEAKIWESGQVDMNPIITWAKNDVLLLAAATRTPLAMLTPDAATQSAEGASLQREGLVFKTEDRIERASVGWSQVLSLMFLMQDDAARAEVGKIRLQWAPVERYSVSERANAIAQTKGVLSRYQQLTEVWGMSPDQAERNLSELQSDMVLDASLLNPPVAPSSGT
jgi:hypothetical protein